MNDKQERYVAFIDILGFKDMVAKSTHDQTLEVLKKISSWLEFIVERTKEEFVQNQYMGVEIKPFIFSDSVILFTNTNSIFAGKLLIYACKYILEKALLENIPIKGAMAFGDITIIEEKSIFFGQAIIDAYLLQEEIKYYGLIFHHTAERQLDLANGEVARLVSKIKTPMKSGKIFYYNIVLNILNAQVIDNKFEIETLNKLYFSVSGPPRIYVDNTVEMFAFFNKDG